MIILENVCKRFGKEMILDHLSLEVESGITLSVTGSSGCGKTTLLKIMAGLSQADSGRFIVDGEQLLDLPIQRRKIVYLSQEPLLFPHLNVFDNIAYGLKVRGVNKTVIKEKVMQLAEDIGLNNLLAKNVLNLSGGQKQRVNFARGLIIKPKMLLLDEPFGSLDNETRAQMQALFTTVTKAQKMSIFFVTHDLKESVIVGDKFLKIQNHKLDLYDNIKSFVESDIYFTKEAEFWQSMTSLSS